MNYSHYDVETIRTVWRCTTPTITLPVASKSGGLADATYTYLGRNTPDDGHHRYQLTGLHEWMPELHPSLRNRADRLPCSRPDGSHDLEAEATQRRKEWKQMREIDGDPFYEDGDE